MSTGENGQTDGAGRLVAGRYRVTAALGRGGMGVVWKAVDEVLGREVAVKELRTYTDAAGPELAALHLRMQREARAAARVRHPGVIAVHDIAQADGRPLIVMELVDGPSLDDVLRERGPLDPDEAAGIGAKVMDALAAAHRAGVLHRDVKPGNILLDRSGRVVLTDFGIATMDDPGDGSATHLTRSGELVGSLDYLAPERAQGADPGPASDIWALGATLYAAVEGSSPFRRTSTFSTLTAIVSEPLPEPRRAGPLGPVLRRLLDKRPESRPEADQARALLQAVADTGGTDTPTSTLRGPAATPPRTETERSLPSVPPGFGPPQQSAAGPGEGTGPGARNPATTPRGTGPVDPGGTPRGTGPVDSGGTTPAASAPTTPMTPDRAASRRKGRVLLAAAAVAVVLAAAGTTVALLGDSGGKETGAGAEAPRAKGGSSEPGGADDGSGAPRATQQGDDDKGGDPSKKPADEKDSEPTGRATGPTPDKPAGDTSGGGSGGGAPADGGSTTPAPVCHPIGGGKYNCQVWKTADSHTASGTKIGILNAGTNYFYCQRNLGRRETSGEWTNVWWAKTDDDSGNTDVWVSDVYIKGGDNDAPVPGLPVC
ncbi:serine/threonine-protein kinase [Streptomyces luteogriseus]|uniref:serine/threonine-protein kinase n=1 Tax=Streptomyces luteogriseus TaxID=68233 RepID=UPI003794B751